MNRQLYAALIQERLKPLVNELSHEFSKPNRIPSFFVDSLLPDDKAREIHRAFPAPHKMVYKKSFRERKAIAAQMNLYDPILEEILYAFQDPGVVNLISTMTGISELLPDAKLYAGGISLMRKGDFLQTHLDNSHDMERKNYRVLNLLYYVSPEWQASNGGNLELWDEGPQKKPRTIVSAFNRFVVMAVGEHSWHSVSPVMSPHPRTCISNYYFSPRPLNGHEYFHVTSFRARPGQWLWDLLLQADNGLRMLIRKFSRKGLLPTRHFYKKDSHVRH